MYSYTTGSVSGVSSKPGSQSLSMRTVTSKAKPRCLSASSFGDSPVVGCDHLAQLFRREPEDPVEHGTRDLRWRG